MANDKVRAITAQAVKRKKESSDLDVLVTSLITAIVPAVMDVMKDLVPPDRTDELVSRMANMIESMPAPQVIGELPDMDMAPVMARLKEIEEKVATPNHRGKWAFDHQRDSRGRAVRTVATPINGD